MMALAVPLWVQEQAAGVPKYTADVQLVNVTSPSASELENWFEAWARRSSVSSKTVCSRTSSTSEQHLYDAIEVLQGYDSIFYGMDNGGSQSRANQKLRNRMPMIAQETGGRQFRLEETTLQEAFDQIEAKLQTLYTLGYNSTNPAKDGKFRKIEIRPADRTLLVRARPGYYSR